METHPHRTLRFGLAAALGAVALWSCQTLDAAEHRGGKGPPREAVAAAEAPSPARADTPPEAAAPQGHAEDSQGVPGEEAMRRLLEGNERMVKGKPLGPNRSGLRRTEVAAAQRPFAVVVTCSDSRVPPEILFDQGYGDLFVVRTAGNVVDEVALGSIEYAVDHLGVRLVLVVGHSKCGAVKATVDGGELPGHLPAIAKAIQPAVDAAREKPGDLFANAVRANVKLVTQTIMKAAPGFSERLEECTLRAAGGYYDLDTGQFQLTYQPVL